MKVTIVKHVSTDFFKVFICDDPYVGIIEFNFLIYLENAKSHLMRKGYTFEEIYF